MVSAIVCAYNEEKTIGPILEVLLSHPKVDEVIVVDDGSTDRTGKIIDSIKSDKLIKIHHPKNLGKGTAIVSATKESKGGFLVFIDGDLVKFHPAHIDLLLSPLAVNPNSMVIGLREPVKPLDKPVASIMKLFNGERALLRNHLIKLLPRIEKSGYGVEVIMNLYWSHHKYPIYYVPLPGLVHILKQDKHPFYKYAADYLQEGKDIVKQYINPDNNTMDQFLKKLVAKFGI